jgi:hypothetical protein
MQYVSASDAKQRLAAILDTAHRSQSRPGGKNVMWPWCFQSRSMSGCVR